MGAADARTSPPPAGRPPGEPREFTYRRRHRLTKDLEYKAVYGHRLKKPSGPLLVFAMPNESVAEARLGLSVGRRVGNAVTRNRVKRLLRESFRVLRGGLPAPSGGGAYDLIVSVRPHEPLPLAAYREHLSRAVERLHRESERRSARGGVRGG